MYGPLAQAIDAYYLKYRELTPRKGDLDDPDVRRQLSSHWREICEAEQKLIKDVLDGRVKLEPAEESEAATG